MTDLKDKELMNAKIVFVTSNTKKTNTKFGKKGIIPAGLTGEFSEDDDG